MKINPESSVLRVRPVCVDFLKLWPWSGYFLVLALWAGCLGKWPFPGGKGRKATFFLRSYFLVILHARK